MVDVTIISIPFFFIGMAIESWVGARRGVRVLRMPDVVCDLSLGVLQVLIGIVFAGALSFGYAYLFTHHRLHTFSASDPLAWLLILAGVDFLYYWFHRASHRSMLAWAAHAPHHSSEDYNLAVALRQGPLQPFVSRLFYLPLAIAGFPVEMFLMMNGINTVYQFWIHTELVGKLGPLEWFLNTPSHHRVHHGTNAKYIDKNHGGMFIVWDRLFGTFIEEAETPRYGTIAQVRTWNPLKAWAAPFLTVWRTTLEARGVQKVYAWLMPPEWSPNAAGGSFTIPDVTGRPKFDSRPQRATQKKAFIAFIVVMAVTTVFLFVVAPRAPYAIVAGTSLAITFALGAVGTLLDRPA